MVKESFHCRNLLGRNMGARIDMEPATAGLVALTACRDGRTAISVHLSPEDIMQFAAVALKIADEIAENELS